MQDILLYRRQFLLTLSPITQLSSWECLRIDQYYLYSHPDLEIVLREDPQKCIVLIGNIYDSVAVQKGNDDILEDIMERADSIESFILEIKPYAGRFALFYKDGNKFALFHDALGLREVYYCKAENQVLCGSQPNLIVEFSSPEITPTSDPTLHEFYTSHMKGLKWDPKCMWLGDETYYEGVKHLLPNHYLDIKKKRACRYWPNDPIKHIGLNEAVAKSCAFLQGNLKAMAHRHKVMMALTAGYDSRNLLAASKDIQDKIYYFVNNEGLGDSHPDIYIPQKMSEKVGLSFRVHNIPEQVDDNFRQIFINNTFFASERILPTIYNVYFKNHSQKVNALGIGEIGRTRFGKEPKNLNGYRLAYNLDHREAPYAIQQCEQILAEMSPVYKKARVNILTGFYWEQMLGNWGATGNSESDIAIEEVNPYNSHKLYEIFLGIDEKYTKYKDNIFFETMIQRMWPELLQFPINPPRNIKGKVAQFLKKAGVYGVLLEIKYKIYYARYKLFFKRKQ